MGDEDNTRVLISYLAHYAGLPPIVYEHADDSGFDLRAAFEEVGMNMVIEPGGRRKIPTGLAFELPSGLELQVRPRSGLADRFGVTVLNAPGTVDAGYRGEVSVILINLGHDPFVVQRGDRIAQGVFGLALRPPLRFVSTLSESDRGADGFGSTGVA